LCAEWCAAYAGRPRTLETLCAALLAELARLTRCRPAGRFDALRASLRSRPELPYTIADLARQAGMSPSHFVRRYKDVVGITPMVDLKNLRVATASHLLMTTALSLKEIAERAGFCDVYYFSRVFRESQGMPPGKFRLNRNIG
jgi:AraC-like DNA-binding protein